MLMQSRRWWRIFFTAGRSERVAKAIEAGSAFLRATSWPRSPTNSLENWRQELMARAVPPDETPLQR